MRSKADFVKDLEKFYLESGIDKGFGIVALDYHKEENGHEWVYVTFSSYSQKKFSVTADNERGIFIDFGKFLADFNRIDWLMPSECIEKFMEGKCGE